MAIVNNERIHGKKIGFTINGVDYWADLKSAALEQKEADASSVTFADYAAGAGTAGKWSLKLSAILSTANASLWRLLWNQAGKTIDFALSPHGNKTATAEQPHFTGKVNIGLRPPISLEAGADITRDFEVTYDCEGDVKLVTESSTMGSGNMEDALADG